MSMGSYFVSEEAANAAIGRLYGKFKAAKEAKAVLESEMSSLSDQLSLLAKVLKNPNDYSFRVGPTNLTVGPPRQEGTIAPHPFLVLEASQMDWKELCETFTKYDKAREDKRESAAQLKQSGLDLPE
jgi:hypothetical protein